MHRTIIAIGIGSALVTAAACGKGGGAGSGKTKTVDLGTTGFVVDVPEGWSVKTDMEGFYSFEGGRPKPQVMVSPLAASSVDDLAKQCEGQSDLVKEAIPTGGAFVSCKGPSKMLQGATTWKLEASIPKGENESFKCHLESDKDITVASKICKSVRKK